VPARAALVGVASGWLFLACSRPAPAPADDPRTVYTLRCASCHGTHGRGDGPLASSLSPPPRDLGDAAWQARIDDTYLRKVIVNGGYGVGLSKQMPGSPDLAAQPATLDGLVGVVRGFRR
jgi:hypothetical protein